MGLYGRVCLSLGRPTALQRGGPEGAALPAHGFGVGDEVALTAMKGGSGGGAGSKRAQLTVGWCALVELLVEMGGWVGGGLDDGV